MNINEVITFLEQIDTDRSFCALRSVSVPFQVTPEEYLEFAERDFTEEGKRHLINALSNAKRALDCRIDSLLLAFGLFDQSKKQNWGVPRKLDIIKELGIIAPNVLKKINRARNLTEHEFTLPDAEKVSDFIDIVSLFLGATRKFLDEFPSKSQFENVNIPEYWLDIEFNSRNAKFIIKVISKSKKTEIIEVILDDPTYIKLMKACLI